MIPRIVVAIHGVWREAVEIKPGQYRLISGTIFPIAGDHIFIPLSSSDMVAQCKAVTSELGEDFKKFISVR